jgi:hypothetical protein
MTTRILFLQSAPSAKSPVKPKTVDCGPWTVDCGLWTVDCGLWTVDCGLWTVDLRL